MAIDLKNPKYYFNRELSWMKFNGRVLEEAMDQSHPLLERLKFLSIFSSNLDEFYMIRVAGLKDQVHAEIHETPPDGLSPRQAIEQISAECHKLISTQSSTLLEDVLPQLRKHGLRLRSYSTLNSNQKEHFRKLFKYKIFPVLTPLGIDQSHPFPALRNLGLNLLVEVKEPYDRERKIAVIPVPQLMDRFITVPGKNKHDFILIEDLIRQHLGQLFPEMKIVSVSEFRITRNADIEISEAEADDLLKQIEKELRKRRLGTVIRLEVTDKISQSNRRFLMKMANLEELDVYDVSGFLDLSPFMALMNLDLPKIKDKGFTPSLSERITSSSSIFSAIKKGDILLHHPYDSFNHVIELVKEAANDANVLAIKQTLYRTSGKSPIVQALKDAVANGKQVTALIELKARFDEATNITWAKELEQSGVNVIYGVLGLKTHCKICMVVRQEGDEIVRYLHMATGNYNAKTAKIYTDFGLLTCNPDIGKDASELFNLLTGYSGQKTWRKFLVAPVNLRDNLLKLFRIIVQNHTTENPSSIKMVMNSLVDPEMIQTMYRCSQKGIKIDLVVRGICCLKPGIKGVSENITVRSIVSRFLQHPRVFIFEYNDQKIIYLGSADLMQRNLNRRVELVFPVEDPALKPRILNAFDTLWSDNVKARQLNEHGDWIRKKPTSKQKPFCAQEKFLEAASRRKTLIDTINIE